jgi:hypothetical protein
MSIRLKTFNADTGEVVYAGRVELGHGKNLTFELVGNVGGHGGGTYTTPWVRLKLDPYEGEKFEACVLRMADWLDAIAVALRAPSVPGPPRGFKVSPPEVQEP